MRLAILICAVGVALGLVGCGADEESAAKAPRVRLDITSPLDLSTVRASTVEVRGRVKPAGARVRILGRPARVTGGGFAATVALESGANVVDVMATAAGRSPSMAAFRVTRDEQVSVPDLVGIGVDELTDRLDALGLKLDIERGGGFFDEFRGGDPAVCAQDPEAGTRVAPGATVHVVVARSC